MHSLDSTFTDYADSSIPRVVISTQATDLRGLHISRKKAIYPLGTTGTYTCIDSTFPRRLRGVHIFTQTRHLTRTTPKRLHRSRRTIAQRTLPWALRTGPTSPPGQSLYGNLTSPLGQCSRTATPTTHTFQTSESSLHNALFCSLLTHLRGLTHLHTDYSYSRTPPVHADPTSSRITPHTTPRAHTSRLGPPIREPFMSPRTVRMHTDYSRYQLLLSTRVETR
jgi:hypothetical protein